MDTEQALHNLGDRIVKNIYSSFVDKDRIATGKTVNAIDVVVEGNRRMYITGPGYLVQLEKGRGATSKTGPYPRYGGLSFKESLALWMAAKGIDQGKKPGSTQEYGPVLWAIYTSLNEKGFSGTPGLLSNPLSNDNLSKAMDETLGPLADIYAKQVLDLLK